MKFSIIIPSNDISLAREARDCLKNFDAKIFDGKGYPSYAKLINDCILDAEEETVIILNHKVRPSHFHVTKMMYLLSKGYGLVCLRNFHFYGFSKNLIRTVGFFDERFKGGGQEDRDFGRRLLEADISIYETVEVPEIQMKSSWNSEEALKFYNKKWQETATDWKRMLPDEKYDYDIGSITDTCSWMSFKHSLLSRTSLPGHRQLKTFNGKPVDFSQLGCSEIF